MNISLTKELEEMVHEKVANGLYTSASEVIREALRLLQEKEMMRAVRLQELRREIDVGIQQANNQEMVPYDSERLKTDVRRHINRKKKKV